MQIEQLENFVKVMDLQALMHVNNAKKEANKYLTVGNELTNVIGRLLYNKNIILDKNAIKPDETKPVLDIYIASDYGMCGAINTNIKQAIRENEESYKILIGKKINCSSDKLLFKIPKDDFMENFIKIEKEMVDAIAENKYSKINIYYHHYNNVSDIKFKKLQLFPIDFDSKSNLNEDFVVETDIELLIKHLVSYYLCYEIKLCDIMSFASENVIRNQLTKVSLTKLEKIKEDTKLARFKKKRSKAITKSVENYKNSNNLDL